MMLSVLKNTKTPVKFWFLKNYLSPTFKVSVLKQSCSFSLGEVASVHTGALRK